MKKTGKRKTYFKPLFKVNSSKSEDVEKQSALMVQNHKMLTNSTTSTTKDGLRRNHAKPKKNQYVLVHSFLDENDKPVIQTSDLSDKRRKSGDHFDIETTMITTACNTTNSSIKRSASCKSCLSSDCQDTETVVSASSMTNTASQGLSNLFKKSIKKNNHVPVSESLQYEDNSNVSTANDSSMSLNKSMDCLSGTINFDPFVSTTSSQYEQNSFNESPEKQHKPSAFRKFYTRNKSKPKPKTSKKSKEAEIPQQINLPTTIEFKPNLNLKNQTQSHSVFPIQPYDYFSSVIHMNKSSRNRSTSSSSSFIRQQQASSAAAAAAAAAQQQQFLNDDSFLNTPSTMATPIDTPLGTPYESFEDVVTPSRTPTTIDDESNLEVCSITTSSTKRFKTLKRSSSIMSLNSSYSVQMGTPVTSTQGGTPIPASPLVSSISNSNTSRSAINLGSSVYPSLTTPSVGTRARMLSCSSSVSIGYSHHVQKSPSNPNIGAKAAAQQQQFQAQQQILLSQTPQQFQTPSQSQLQVQYMMKNKLPTPQSQPAPQISITQSQLQLQFQQQQQLLQQQQQYNHQQQQLQQQQQQQLQHQYKPAVRSNNSSTVKSGINLDTYLSYMDDKAKIAHQESSTTSSSSFEISNSDSNLGLNILMDNRSMNHRMPTIQHSQSHPSPHPKVQRNPYYYQQSPSSTPPASNHYQHHQQQHQQQQHLPQQQSYQHQQQSQLTSQPQSLHTEQTERRDNPLVHEMIEKQQQQILSQQLHHDNPQILHNIQSLQDMIDIEDELNGITQLDGMNDLDFDTESAKNNDEDDDSAFINELLTEDLDQLINITRLEALAKEVEDFGTSTSTTTLILPSQNSKNGGNSSSSGNMLNHEAF